MVPPWDVLRTGFRSQRKKVSWKRPSTIFRSTVLRRMDLRWEGLFVQKRCQQSGTSHNIRGKGPVKLGVSTYAETFKTSKIGKNWP